MIAELVRIARRPAYTIGRLYINGAYVCDTLEDADRGLTNDMDPEEIRLRKFAGETAIPTGRYRIEKRQSPRLCGRPYGVRYNGYFPALPGVKGFSGILIHPGNTAEDTLGCILPGKNRVVGKVVESTATYCMLMDEYFMPAWERKEEIWLTVR